MEQEHIMQYFEYAHLKPELQRVSMPFCILARAIVGEGSLPIPPGFPLPRNPERTVALRKLLEAKDAAVRAFIAKSAPQPSKGGDVNIQAGDGPGGGDVHITGTVQAGGLIEIR